MTCYQHRRWRRRPRQDLWQQHHHQPQQQWRPPSSRTHQWHPGRQRRPIQAHQVLPSPRQRSHRRHHSQRRQRHLKQRGCPFSNPPRITNTRTCRPRRRRTQSSLSTVFPRHTHPTSLPACSPSAYSGATSCFCWDSSFASARECGAPCSRNRAGGRLRSVAVVVREERVVARERLGAVPRLPPLVELTPETERVPMAANHGEENRSLPRR